MSLIIRPINAQAGEIVEIRWRNAGGEILIDRCTAPPLEAWKARYALQTAGRQAEVSETLADESATSVGRVRPVSPVWKGSGIGEMGPLSDVSAQSSSQSTTTARCAKPLGNASYCTRSKGHQGDCSMGWIME